MGFCQRTLKVFLKHLSSEFLKFLIHYALFLIPSAFKIYFALALYNRVRRPSLFCCHKTKIFLCGGRKHKKEG